MFINPKTAIENGWVTHPKCNSLQDWEDNKFISPNAIDFTLDKVFYIRTGDSFVISEEGKQMRDVVEADPVLDRRYKEQTGKEIYFWHLREPLIDGMSNMFIRVPEDTAAMLIIRSTFSRNGIFLTSGLWDAGFTGHIGVTIHNRAPGLFSVAKGTRIGQVMFVRADNAKLYSGGWSHEEGTHYSEKSREYYAGKEGEKEIKL